VRAASFEAPISETDRAFLGDAALARAEMLAAAGELARAPAGLTWAGRDYPAARMSLRSTDPDSVSIVVAGSGQILGIVETGRACSTVHEGAVYLHLGQSYRVQSLDLQGRIALVEEFDGDYYTQTKRETTMAVEGVKRLERRLGVELAFGELGVTEQVVAYQRRSVRTQEALDLCALDLPPQTFSTEGVWFCPAPALLGEEDDLLGTLHAAEHALIALLPLWAMCDRWDIGGLSTNIHPQTGAPTIFVYDGHPGGVGITERGFDRFEGWVADTERLLAGCPCERGCPSCVQSPKCGNLNEPLSKGGALRLLRALLAVR
jgi:DEAD/DEAH box helicase domain-containing protein